MQINYISRNLVSNKMNIFISILFIAARVAIGEEKLIAQNLLGKINDSIEMGTFNNLVHLTYR